MTDLALLSMGITQALRLSRIEGKPQATPLDLPGHDIMLVVQIADKDSCYC